MDISENSSESGEATELSEIESLKMQLESVNEELSRQTALAQDYLDTARRVQAEFENYKKRMAKEREQIVSCANERLLCDILIIYDDLQRALEAECEADELRNGISKIHTNLANFLKENGVREIPVDGKFDPSCHEALAMGEGEDGTILEVYQKGYYLGNKVLRTSKVKVARSK
ncbi:MAG TPA: nucleotide exchange factor GrpE [Methanomassiliicoccaceae archaeon]|nr:nucleotide exchange factor GrpE [Euryarchaeota archaeon]HOB37679.1 nucleotide exchange factor GrpE [Methanomassiliicoccaceae archaeon]HOK28839.1 nucleotide exchange factor GrpE [Methanomassiliicoccaceae archaeon]HOL07164.1 nucleotide exchange factor GrpE [Methanomassiliicoccaceae archaeon]HOQ25743.1 nucleotide exchange factor GrpE [Methanomassiliicoccaceae archaeon]